MAEPVVTSTDRLTFTLFLALLIHALVVLGITFTQPTNTAEAPHTMDVTLASFQSEKAPEQADFLAQANQQGSGELDEAKMQTTDVQAMFNDTSPQDATLQTEQHSSPQAAPKQEQVVHTDAETSEQYFEQEDSDFIEEPVQEGPPQLLLPNSREIASLEAKLERQRQNEAKRSKVRRFNAATTLSSNDALYLNSWRARIEENGSRNYPREAENCFNNCRLRLLVSIRADGTIHKLTILESSGRKVLDDAALRIVRLSAPFAPFNEEMKKNTDVLEIIRTWQFKGNRYLSEAG